MTESPKHLIVGTAGHIDHGKSALVKALTGIDPDRLPEEQERGITIDLGFAHMECDDGLVLSFVDVPGHERFVKNMLAGAGGVDLVLLVVAADESVMPQTLEHFHICRLLGVRRGLIALTKTDLVEADLVSLVRLEVEELVAGSFLEGAPILPVSSVTKEGLDDLVEAFREVDREVAGHSAEGPFRLPVDRVFTIRGFGTVVTGTGLSGRVREGDTLEIHPRGERVKVRGLQVHGGECREAGAGQRVALNLQGISRGEISRGDWLTEPGRYGPVPILDARVEMLAGAPAPLEDMDRVRFHAGALEALARVRVLEPGGKLPPGTAGTVQIRLEGPVHTVVGERFVLRRYSPVTTIGGGVVLDPAPPKRTRRLPAPAGHFEDLFSGDPACILAAWVRAAGESGLPASEAFARTDWTEGAVREAVEQLVAGGEVTRAGGVLLAAERWKALEEQAAKLLEAHHAAQPLSPGLPGPELRAALGMEEETFRAFIEEGEASGRLRREGEFVAAAAHEIVLSPEEQALRDSLEAAFRKGGLTPPEEKEVLASNDHPRTRDIFQLLLEGSVLVRLKGGSVYHLEVLDRLVEEIRRGPETFSVPEFKQKTRTTRKHAIPLLEYLDGRNVTCRTGDLRRVVPELEA